MTRTIAYLGPQGTYCEETVLSLYEGNTDISMKPCLTIYEAIRSVAAGEVDESIVPVENSLEGSVNITLDTIAHDVDLFITKEIILPVRHNLLAKTDTTEIEVIVSHPQALAQCRKNLSKLYPHAQLVPVESTAAAARMVATGDGAHAAVGSLKAGEFYGLSVIAANIEDNTANSTRFIGLERQPVNPASGQCKTALVCQIDGAQPGSLYNLLGELAKRSVNLMRIESRPARTGLGMYIFFLDIEGSINASNIADAVGAIKEKSIWYKNLGSYPVYQILK